MPLPWTTTDETGRFVRDPRTAEERFWAKVNKTDTCWLWTGAVNSDGYGNFKFGTDTKPRPVHRWVYETLVGPIPDGLQLDHLCRVRHCVRPDHLEPVTSRENTLRGEAPTAVAYRDDTCLQGHPLVGSNVQVHKGRRECRACVRTARLTLARGRGTRPYGSESLCAKGCGRVVSDSPGPRAKHEKACPGSAMGEVA